MHLARFPLTAALVFLGVAGCATNPLVGNGATQSGRYKGNVGITGHGTTLTIESGSRVPKLSIVGDGCKVTVEDGVEIQKIEFWGNGSTVNIPEDLEVKVSAMGSNKVLRRPAAASSADHRNSEAPRPEETSEH